MFPFPWSGVCGLLLGVPSRLSCLSPCLSHPVSLLSTFFSLCFRLCLPQSVVCFHVFYPLGGRATSCFGSPSSHVCVRSGFPCLVIPNLSLLCSQVLPLSLITLTVSVLLCPSPECQFTSLHASGSMFYVPSVYFCPV